MGKTAKNPYIKEIYKDFAVCLGGIFAVHKELIDDELIWEISRSLERLFRKHLSRFGKSRDQGSPDKMSPHPAIINLLERIKEVS